MEYLLEIKHLTTVFPAGGRVLKAVDDVSFSLTKGEVFCLVGESGCGKSMTALSILGLVPPPGMVTGGQVLFRGRDLRTMGAEELRLIRGDRISMVFQEPMSALNPVFTVGEQVAEVLRVHRSVTREQAMERVVELLGEVGIPDPDRRSGEYPHQMSGGMQQRALIAMAMACEPELLIADEPTTALDVTVQAQILRLMERLIRGKDRSLLLITHDLGIVAEVADRVCVMYAGAVVESSPVKELFAYPQHPYTLGLMASLPSPERRKFTPITGMVPDLADLPGGCRFHPRCQRAREVCVREEPELVFTGKRAVRCYFPGKGTEEEEKR
ncbi:MAG: ABC transporter ATP-binding protein [bacterium]|nr:ABC transporter ATP-binding protein [bacterium]MDT8395179.1 ABC transporter ATP-binding protein [bacterium]